MKVPFGEPSSGYTLSTSCGSGEGVNGAMWLPRPAVVQVAALRERGRWDRQPAVVLDADSRPVFAWHGAAEAFFAHGEDPTQALLAERFAALVSAHGQSRRTLRFSSAGAGVTGVCASH